MGNALVQSAEIKLKDQGGGVFGSNESGSNLTPLVSSVSGSLTEDSIITISGSGFSAERQTPLYYDDYGVGVVGDVVTGITDNHSYKYQDDDAYTGSQSAMWHHPLNDMSLIHPRIEVPDNTKELFVFHAQKIIEINNGDGLPGDEPQIKLTRLVSGQSGTAHSDNPLSSMMWQTLIGWNYITLTDGGGNTETYTVDLPQVGVWQTFIGHMKLSDPGQANGSVMCKAYGSHGRANKPGGGHYGDLTGVTPLNSWNMPSNRMTLAANPDNTQLKKVFLPFYMRHQQDYKIYVDNFVVNDTREIIILADNSDLKLATLNTLVALPSMSRAEDLIEARMKRGKLSGQHVYMFVFNADGSYNSVGYDMGVL